MDAVEPRFGRDLVLTTPIREAPVDDVELDVLLRLALSMTAPTPSPIEAASCLAGSLTTAAAMRARSRSVAASNSLLFHARCAASAGRGTAVEKHHVGLLGHHLPSTAQMRHLLPAA
jgi:hypothetical protein